MALAALVAAAMAVSADGAAGTAVSPGDLPDGTVALVSHVPAELGWITEDKFQRALVQRAALEGRAFPPDPRTREYRELRERVMGDLLDGVWIQGQALQMGIAVPRRKVLRELAHIKKESFKSEAGYRHYLKEAHLTQVDVEERVELELLVDRMQERVEAGPAGFKAFIGFVKAYSERWRDRTVCAPEYAVDRCSNGPPLASAQ